MARDRKLGLVAVLVVAAALAGAQACGNSGSPFNAAGPSALPAGAGLEAKPGGISAVQLNLSHIECVVGGVEIHFVLLHVPTGATVGNLSWWNDDVLQTSTIAPVIKPGNAIHFTAVVSPGTYNITAATVVVNGTTINLHNPGDYSGTYNCDQPFGCPTFQLPDEYTGTRVCLPVLGNPSSECGLLGLAPDGKDEPIDSEPHVAPKDAAVAIVKDGAVGCETGHAYRFYSPVTAGQLLSRPEGSGAISHVTYCACPAN